MAIVGNSLSLAFHYTTVSIVHHMRALSALFHSSVVDECSVTHGSERVMSIVNLIHSSGCSLNKEFI